MAARRLSIFPDSRTAGQPLRGRLAESNAYKTACHRRKPDPHAIVTQYLSKLSEDWRRWVSSGRHGTCKGRFRGSGKTHTNSGHASAGCIVRAVRLRGDHAWHSRILALHPLRPV